MILWALIKKEFLQMVRDPSSILIAFVLPLILLIIYMYGINLDTFRERAEKAQVALVPDGSKNDGYTLGGDTEAIEAFVRTQLADPEFFDAEPLYSFQKLPAAAP